MKAPVATSVLDTPGWLVVGAGTLLLLGLSTLVPIPVAIAPYSFVLVAPALLAASTFSEAWLFAGVLAGALVAPLTFLGLASHVVKAGKIFPKRSVAIFAVLACLSLTDAVLGWENTVQYTSHSRALALVLQAVLPPIFLVSGGLALRKSLTVRGSLVLHWLGLAWLVWGAFPWYGELM